MRDLQQYENDSSQPLNASDFNAINSELENVVTSTDQTLDPQGGPNSDLNMLGKAAAIYGSAGEGYSDSGSANTYVLARSTNLKSPTEYFDGMKVIFIPANTNTSSCTINVASLGVKNLKSAAGNALIANDIIEDEPTRAVYVSGSDEFRLMESNIQNLNTYNFITNGNFEIAQEATSHTTDGYGSLDMWYLNLSGATATMSQQAFTLGQTDVPGEPKNYMRIAVTGADDNCGAFQHIEGVRTLAGQTATLSIWAKADASRTLSFQTKQNFGTGGSPSSEVQATQENFSLTTSWAKYENTFTLASITGKTLGSNGNDFLGIMLVNPTNETSTIEIAQVTLTIGRISIPFVARPKQMELELCQRQYQKSYDQDVVPGTSAQHDQGNPNPIAGTTTFLQGVVTFPVVMRATPTVTIYSPNGGNSGKVENNTQTEQTGSVTSVETSETGIGLVTYDTASFTKGDLYQYHYTADARL